MYLHNFQASCGGLAVRGDLVALAFNGTGAIMRVLTLWLLIYTISNTKRALYLLLSICVLLAFKTKSLFCFYLFYEFRVVPITLIIFLYGYQPEKIQASLSLLIYIVRRRLPLLLFLLTDKLTFVSSYLTIPMTLGFMVKTPLYLLHT